MYSTYTNIQYAHETDVHLIFLYGVHYDIMSSLNYY